MKVLSQFFLLGLFLCLVACNAGVNVNGEVSLNGGASSPTTEEANSRGSSAEEAAKPSPKLEELLKSFPKGESISQVTSSSGKKLDLSQAKGLLKEVLQAGKCEVIESNFTAGHHYLAKDGTYFLGFEEEGGEEDMTPAGPPTCFHVLALSAEGQILDYFTAEFGLAGAAMTQARINTTLSENAKGEIERETSEGETSYYDNYDRGVKTKYLWTGKNWKKLSSQKYDEKFMEDED